MSSYSVAGPRRVPQQQRGQRRVAAFLNAAASVVCEVGYERATMSAIAERSQSCIGSLYQFFPNKESLADALCAGYVEEIKASWKSLGGEAGMLTAAKLACRLVDLQIDIVTNHPALLALLDAPPTACTLKRREQVRELIAEVLLAHQPKLPRREARLTASVVQHLSRALLTLYASTDADAKRLVVQDFRKILTGYLVPKLKR
jgi:AcrR family transcriptional regulator